jgi:thiamine kinase-like enzyme
VVVTHDDGGSDGVEASLPAGLLDRVAVLAGRPRRVTELTGGLTNRNLKVVTDGGTYVVRLSGPTTGALAIDREHEYRNSVAAAATGVGAPVVDYLPGQGVLVVGFLEGPTFTDATFGLPGVVERVAEACRRLHAGPRFVNDFDMFEVQRGYLDLVLDRGFRLPPDYLEHAERVERIRRALAARPVATVPCNNDLLAGNFIDDGRDVRIIDYEYAGNNDPAFELGNVWSECHLTDDQLELLVAAYHGRPLRNRVARARLQGLMGQYGWTLWASIQEATSPIPFDYWSWGMEKYERAVRTFRGPGFDRLLDEVQRDD